MNCYVFDVQYNKLLSYCRIPPWICCNLEGNGRNTSSYDFLSSSVEMDVYDNDIQQYDGGVSRKGEDRETSFGCPFFFSKFRLLSFEWSFSHVLN